MNLLDYREALWREVDHAPGGSPEGKIRTHKDIERALYELFTEMPFLFRVQNREVYIEPDLVMESDTDLLEVAENVTKPVVNDGWVLQTQYPTSHPLADKWLATDRNLDGRTLRITDPDDAEYYHYFKIREIWQAAPNLDVAGDIRIRISLWDPIPTAWYTEDLEWRVLTGEYSIPNDIIRLKDMSIDVDGSTFPISIAHEGRAEDLAVTDPSHELGGLGSSPYTAYRRPAEGMARPIVAPSVTINTGKPGDWDTAVTPLGTFEYFWTISHGFRVKEAAYGDPEAPSDEDFATGRLKPYWESAPSPVSGSAEVNVDTKTVTLSFPDLQRLIGFSSSSTIRYTHTGLYINIYRRRVEADGNGRSYSSEHAYYVTRFKADGTITWIDNGSLLEAHRVPLRENTQYQTFRFDPIPDGKYRIRMRAYIRPIPPKDEYEDMPIPDDAQNALIFLAAQHFYRRSGNAAFALHYQQLFTNAKAQLSRTYGQAKPRKRPLSRGLARVRSTRPRGGSRLPLGLITNV